MPKPEVAGQCGCGRSPTGRCIGWHGLTEEGYMDKLNLWIAEQAQADKEDDERSEKVKI